MAPKRPAEMEAPPTTAHDFSSSVKKKLSNSTRTGQACDRCKIRKIRCDGRVGGCSPCAQNNTPCKTTDRITGRATTRGHTEHLEAENNYLRSIIADQEAQLRGLGADVKAVAPYPSYVPSVVQPPPPQPVPQHNPQPRPQPPPQSWPSPDTPLPRTPFGPPYLTQIYHFNAQTAEGSLSPPFGSGGTSVALPTFKAGCAGDNYLGISSADSLLSPIKGTSLSFFGVELDLRDFVPQEADEENAPTSYQTFLRVAWGIRQVDRLDVPDEKELREYVGWYFRSLHPYSPLMHRPSVMRLLWDMYNTPGFKPSAAQEVIVHMILAHIKYQISVRNSQPQLLEDAHNRYLYSISLFPQLLLSHTLEDVQALALIAIHIRNFPKPGAAWLATHLTLNVATELGLHRSSKAWAETISMTQHEIELRKRVFWTVFTLDVSLSGRLGRPMALRLEDMDVEFPMPENDTEEGDGQEVREFSDCSFHIGLSTPRIGVILAKMYSTVYAVRQTPLSYERTVRALEEEIRIWRASLPPELLTLEHNEDNYIFVRYVHVWEQELQLLLHHPVLCASSNAEFVNYNMSACLKASKELMRHVSELSKYKSLDIPWINVTLYLAAVFTTLYIHTRHKQDTTPQEVEELRDDMNSWIKVFQDIGEIYGTAGQLPSAVRNIVDQSMEIISNRVAEQTAGIAIAETPSPHQSQRYEQGQNTYPEEYNRAQSSPDTKHYVRSRDHADRQQPHHQPTTHNNHKAEPSYGQQQQIHELPQYSASRSDTSNMTDDQRALQLRAVIDTPAQPPHHGHRESMYTVHTPMTNQHGAPQRVNFGATWQEWTRQHVGANLNGHHIQNFPATTSPAQQAHMTSASALMALGSDNRRHSMPVHTGVGPTSSVAMHSGPPAMVAPHTLHGLDPQTQWPMFMWNGNHQ